MRNANRELIFIIFRINIRVTHYSIRISHYDCLGDEISSVQGFFGSLVYNIKWGGLASPDGES